MHLSTSFKLVMVTDTEKNHVPLPMVIKFGQSDRVLIVGLDKIFPKKMEGSRDLRRLAERSPAERQGLGRQSK